MKALALALTGVLLTTSCATAPAKPRWTAFADCAAAYRVNADLADPSRAATMKAMVSEEAGDYRTAALAHYRQKNPTGSTGAEQAVDGRIIASASAYARKSREQVEHVIDACPQTDG